MIPSTIIGLINNTALLMALVLLYDVFHMGGPGQKSAIRQIPLGIALGCIGVAIMMNHWEFIPGIIFDARSVLLCITGLFFGAVPTLVTAVICIGYRLFIGGPGVWTGAAVIITSGGIGLAWRYWRKNEFKEVSSGNLYAIGMVTHVLMLLWMLTLPRWTSFDVLVKISIPVLLIFPLATVLLGKFMINRFHRVNSTVALKQSEEKYRNLIGSLQEGVWQIDKDNLTTFVNRPMADILGYTVEEMIGRSLFSFMDKQGLQIAEQNLERRQKGIAEQHEFEFLKKDGSTVYVIIETRPVKDNKGNYSGAIAGVIDITARKQAIDELRESEAKYRALFENMTAGFVLFQALQDDDGTPVDLVIVAANKGFEAATGLKTQEVIGKRLTKVLPGIEKDAADWIQTYGKVALTGESRQFEQGSELLGYYYSIIAYQAGPRQCAVTFVDITKRKRAEKERERMLTAIEQTDDMVIITAPDGKIQYVNPSFEAVTGYTRTEALGKNPRMLKSGKQDQGFYSDLWQTIGSGNVWKGRMVNRRKDGDLYTEDSTISPVMDSAGRIVNYVSVKRDISEQLRINEEKAGLEQQLLQAQKMESVGRLAGGVAHDFNNMLSIITGYTELAVAKVGPAGALYSDLMEILQAAKRSSDITRQLLAFARQQTAAPKVIDLNDNIESMLRMLQRLIGEDIHLAWLPGGDLWPVKIDPSHVDQLLANLCVNARDAMAGGGRLTIETGNRTFDEQYCNNHAEFVPGRFVLLAVSDTGGGMAPAVLDKIFEPFFTTKDLHQGTGLGLATVYGIVKQNNGFINVYSEPGKGTTFKIYLPQHTGQIVEVRRESTQQIPLSRGETILLVEDEASLLKLGERMLKKIGYAVLSANTPSEAIELAKEHGDEINLLLTDVVMPEMNGRELSEHVQKQCPNIKTLFMSGYTANVIAHRGVLEKGVHFITKPLSNNELAIKVREALDDE